MRHRSWPRAAGILAALALAAVVGALALSWFEDSFIYHPSRAIDASPEILGLPFEDVRLRAEDGETIAAWWFPAGDPLAAILFLHGNAGNRSHRLNDVAILVSRGLSVLIPDYRGYAESTGRPSEKGLALDARAAWDHMTGALRIPAGRVVLYGESLGSAPALALASRLRDEGRAGPGAVVLEGAFTSAREMGRRVFPFLPVGWLMRTRFDNLSAVRRIDTPLLLVHAENDEISPLSMGRRLHQASAARLKDLLVVPGATHNTTWLIAGPAIGDRVRRFIARAIVRGA